MDGNVVRVRDKGTQTQMEEMTRCSYENNIAWYQVV